MLPQQSQEGVATLPESRVQELLDNVVPVPRPTALVCTDNKTTRSKVTKMSTNLITSIERYLHS